MRQSRGPSKDTIDHEQEQLVRSCNKAEELEKRRDPIGSVNVARDVTYQGLKNAWVS